MYNIFKSAYFGKPYKTRDGRKALYHSTGSKYKEYGDHLLIIENSYGYFHYDDSGVYYHNNTTIDIISEWQEEINEEELDELTNIATKELYGGFEHTKSIWQNGFKAGLLKAKK